MIWIILLAVWLLSSSLAFWLFQWSWRWDYDLTSNDVTFFAVSALIPVLGLLVATIVALTVYPWRTTRTRIVRKKHIRKAGL